MDGFQHTIAHVMPVFAVFSKKNNMTVIALLGDLHSFTIKFIKKDEVHTARLAFRKQRLKRRSAPSSADGGRTMWKLIRTVIVPDWLTMDYSQPVDDDFDIKQARRELEERLKKYKTNPDG